MEKEIVFVLLDEFADWEAAFLAPALCSGVMPGRPGSYAAKYMSPDGESVRSIDVYKRQTPISQMIVPIIILKY